MNGEWRMADSDGLTGFGTSLVLFVERLDDLGFGHVENLASVAQFDEAGILASDDSTLVTHHCAADLDAQTAHKLFGICLSGTE